MPATVRDADAPYPQVARRIVPAVFALYVLAQIDRGNIAYVKTQLTHQFGFDDAVFGLGIGVFYLGYALCEIPSNVLLARVGARRWLARILATWGAVCIAMVLMRGVKSFYLCRLLLGVAEAGMSPGALLYLTFWFPSRLRARASATFLASIPIAIVLSGPLSGLCLNLDGVLGIAGWKWLFALEGLPSIVAAFAVLRWLPDGPADARWLDDEGRARIAADLAAERSDDGSHSPWRLLAQPALWALIVPYFLLISGFYGVINWLPTLLKHQPFAAAYGDLAIGAACSLPYIAAAIAMVLAGRSSDRRRERRRHTAVAGGAAAIGLVIAALPGGGQVAMVAGLTIGCCGMFAAVGTFWSLAVERLAERDRVVGIACINAIGCLGGFAGPYLMGLRGPEAGLGALAASFALFAALVLALRSPRDAAPAPAVVAPRALAA